MTGRALIHTGDFYALLTIGSWILGAHPQYCTKSPRKSTVLRICKKSLSFLWDLSYRNKGFCWLGVYHVKQRLAKAPRSRKSNSYLDQLFSQTPINVLRYKLGRWILFVCLTPLANQRLPCQRATNLKWHVRWDWSLRAAPGRRCRIYARWFIGIH